MNEEQDLEIVENKGFKNLQLKPNVAKGIAGLEDGNFVIIEKTFAEGREVTMPTHTFYSCGARYKDTDISFILNPKEHEIYKNTGGVGDRVKITLKKEPYVNPMTGAEGIAKRVYFEVVD